MDIFSLFQSRIKDYGAKCKMVSINHIEELESEYNKPINDSLVNKSLYDKYIKDYFDFSIKEKHPLVNSLIIIATPSPQTDLKLKIADKDFWVKIPPTYSDRIEITDRIKKITSDIFNNNGYKTFPIILPKKLIAVKSGLAKYGKNNLAYVEGMGSYHRLTLFATDLHCDNDSWQDVETLDRCKRCLACQKNCPTSAINGDNFVIHAERCLTFFNEQPEQFPDWISSSAHNSIIGCMKCQEICPENKLYATNTKIKAEFDEKETSMILNNISFNELPQELQTKLDNLCLKYYYKKLARNITQLIDN